MISVWCFRPYVAVAERLEANSRSQATRTIGNSRINTQEVLQEVLHEVRSTIYKVMDSCTTSVMPDEGEH